VKDRNRAASAITGQDQPIAAMDTPPTDKIFVATETSITTPGFPRWMCDESASTFWISTVHINCHNDSAADTRWGEAFEWGRDRAGLCRQQTGIEAPRYTPVLG